jgi:hypothetical protein
MHIKTVLGKKFNCLLLEELTKILSDTISVNEPDF